MSRQPPRGRRRTCGTLSRKATSALAVAIVIALASCSGDRDRSHGGRSARAWAAQLSSPRTADRVAAAEALYHIAPRSDDVVADLISAMRDTSGEVQDAVVVALSTVGTRAIPGLIEALNDDHVSVRLIALAVLAERTGDASSITRAIGRALSDSSDEVRIAAAHTLQRIGPAARDAETQLLETARNAAVPVRAAALQALVANGAGHERLRPVLEAALRDSAAALRTTAVSLAVEAGMTAEEAFPAILALTTDSSSIVRQAAFRALEALLGAPTVGLRVRGVLERAASHPDSVVRRIAHRALSPITRATTNH